MRTEPTTTAPLAPALIGAALDCLAQLPDGHLLDPSLLTSVARAIGCSSTETPALMTRIRAAAAVMNDPRWPAWPVAMKTAGAEERQAFDAALLRIIAGLPLTDELWFSGDDFYDALMASAIPLSRA